MTPDSYEHLKDTFGRDLEAAAAAQTARAAPIRRSRVRARRVLIGAGALAAAGSIAVLALGSGAAERIDVIAEAQAALAPKVGILHMRVVVRDASTVDGEPIASTPGTSRRQRFEQWVATNPGRWRFKSYEAQPPTRRSDGTTRPVVRPLEVAFAGGAETSYDPRTDRISIVTGLPMDLAHRPLGPTTDRNSEYRLDEIRKMLTAGELRAEGPQTVNGRRVLRLTGESRDQMGARFAVQYDVDPSTFAPVRMRTQWRPRSRGTSAGGQTQLSRLTLISVLDFEVFEHLPLTEPNEALLKVQAPAGTPVVSRTAAEVRAAARP